MGRGPVQFDVPFWHESTCFEYATTWHLYSYTSESIHLHSSRCFCSSHSHSHSHLHLHLHSLRSLRPTLQMNPYRNVFVQIILLVSHLISVNLQLCSSSVPTSGYSQINTNLPSCQSFDLYETSDSAVVVFPNPCFWYPRQTPGPPGPSHCIVPAQQKMHPCQAMLANDILGKNSLRLCKSRKNKIVIQGGAQPAARESSCLLSPSELFA